MNGNDIPSIKAIPDAADLIRRVEFVLIRCSPDRVNEIGRDSGLPVQAVSLTNSAGDKIYLSWPPNKKSDPQGELGMGYHNLCRALGDEIISNLLHEGTDEFGR